MKTDRFYTFQVSLSKDAYKTKDETKAAVAERNTGAPDKPCGKSVRMLTQNCR